MVEAATRWPSRRSSPWIRTTPTDGSWLAVEDTPLKTVVAWALEGKFAPQLILILRVTGASCSAPAGRRGGT